MNVAPKQRFSMECLPVDKNKQPSNFSVSFLQFIIVLVLHISSANSCMCRKKLSALQAYHSEINIVTIYLLNFFCTEYVYTSACVNGVDDLLENSTDTIIFVHSEYFRYV